MTRHLRSASTVFLSMLVVGMGAPAVINNAALAVAPDASGLDVTGVDRSIEPGDDFYAYANGTWAKSVQIPADSSSWGTFNQMNEDATRKTRELLEQAGQGKAPTGSDERQIGDYFAAFMDEQRIESKGLASLQPALQRIAAIKNAQSLARVLGESLRADVDALNTANFYTENLFGLWVAPGFDGNNRYTAYLLQGGLGLPDREYYLADTAKMSETRDKYRAHISTLLELAGLVKTPVEAQAKAQSIFDLERRIAEQHASRVDSVDVNKANNPWPRTEFAVKAPGLDWAEFFAAAKLNKQTIFTVWQPGAVTGIAKIVGGTPVAVWKDYLSYHRVNHFSPYLSKALADEYFAFHGTTLSGTPQQRERWKRAVDATNSALGEAVGQVYVKNYFPREAKAKVQAMVENIKAAFGRRIDALQWMSAPTRAQAKEKVATLYVGTGYPDHWRSYAGLKIDRNDALGNQQRAEEFQYEYWRSKLGRSVDRTAWVMTPQTVNALNLPLQNALNVPAAILQRPFFDPDAFPAVNYGGMGALIGHEISHSFDNQGSQFDAHGKLIDWWTPADMQHFEASSKKLVEQYNAYRPFPDATVNGQLTLSENIADVAGLAAAHDGWLASLGGKTAPQAQGFTGEQQFLLSFAQLWRSQDRETSARRKLLTNGHSPGRYRADTVRNLDAWYEAFDVKPGQNLYLAPKERVTVW
jgi:putative endopeptidase